MDSSTKFGSTEFSLCARKKLCYLEKKSSSASQRKQFSIFVLFLINNIQRSWNVNNINLLDFQVPTQRITEQGRMPTFRNMALLVCFLFLRLLLLLFLLFFILFITTTCSDSFMRQNHQCHRASEIFSRHTCCPIVFVLPPPFIFSPFSLSSTSPTWFHDVCALLEDEDFQGRKNKRHRSDARSIANLIS